MFHDYPLTVTGEAGRRSARWYNCGCSREEAAAAEIAHSHGNPPSITTFSGSEGVTQPEQQLPRTHTATQRPAAYPSLYPTSHLRGTHSPCIAACVSAAPFASLDVGARSAWSAFLVATEEHAWKKSVTPETQQHMELSIRLLKFYRSTGVRIRQVAKRASMKGSVRVTSSTRYGL